MLHREPQHYGKISHVSLPLSSSAAACTPSGARGLPALRTRALRGSALPGNRLQAEPRGCSGPAPRGHSSAAGPRPLGAGEGCCLGDKRKAPTSLTLGGQSSLYRALCVTKGVSYCDFFLLINVATCQPLCRAPVAPGLAWPCCGSPLLSPWCCRAPARSCLAAGCPGPALAPRAHGPVAPAPLVPEARRPPRGAALPAPPAGPHGARACSPWQIRGCRCPGPRGAWPRVLVPQRSRPGQPGVSRTAWGVCQAPAVPAFPAAL